MEKRNHVVYYQFTVLIRQFMRDLTRSRNTCRPQRGQIFRRCSNKLFEIYCVVKGLMFHWGQSRFTATDALKDSRVSFNLPKKLRAFVTCSETSNRKREQLNRKGMAVSWFGGTHATFDIFLRQRNKWSDL